MAKQFVIGFLATCALGAAMAVVVWLTVSILEALRPFVGVPGAIAVFYVAIAFVIGGITAALSASETK